MKLISRTLSYITGKRELVSLWTWLLKDFKGPLKIRGFFENSKNRMFSLRANQLLGKSNLMRMSQKNFAIKLAKNPGLWVERER
jgi:hypothetical protein